MDMGHSPNVKKKVMATFMMTNLQDQYQGGEHSIIRCLYTDVRKDKVGKWK